LGAILAAVLGVGFARAVNGPEVFSAWILGVFFVAFLVAVVGDLRCIVVLGCVVAVV
jgi:hypothetical protein